MSTQPIPAISATLNKFGIGLAHQRSNLAAKVHSTGRILSESAVQQMMVHFSNGGGDATSMVAQSLADGTWVALSVDLAREAEESRSARDEAMAKADSSRMSKVSESNPYGWDQPDDRRHADHDIPGEWNPFRQSYNLTAAERGRHKVRDHKRRGCSRWEVLGGTKSGTRQSKVDYEPLEVSKAMGRDFGEPVSAVERGVYGES